MKSILYVVIATLLFGCEPVANVSKEDRLKLYNDALDQIITENYFQHCLDFDEKVEAIQRDFTQGKMDSLTYLRIGDSLKEVRKTTLPKCVLDYADEFQIFTTGHGLNDNIRNSITGGLSDTFISNFANVSVKAIVDTLSQTARLNVKDLATSYLEIIPYTKRPHRPYGDGMGVISFSRTYFSKEADKAILFYEFNCGPKCGSGEIVFLERANGKWKIVEYKRIWDS